MAWQRHRWAFALGLVTVASAAYRLARWPYRWNQIALAYAAYHEPFVTAAARGDALAAAGTFVGLHPPLYSALFALVYEGVGRPGALLMLSALLSTVAVLLAGLAGWRAYGGMSGVAAAAVLGASLYHGHYSLEVNNYPLLVMVAAASHLAFARALRGPAGGSMGVWALAMAALVWTHILGALLAATQLLALAVSRRGARAALRGGMWLGLLILPLLPRLLQLTTAGSTYHNDSGGMDGFFEQVIVAMVGRFGPPWAILALAVGAGLGALRGMRDKHTRVVTAYHVAAVLLPAAGVTTLTLLGVSAAHQHPYYLFILPSVAVLAGRGVAFDPAWGRLRQASAAALCLLMLVGSAMPGAAEIAQARRRAEAFARAPHPARAVVEAAIEAPGGAAIWLVAPALYPDDDKLAQDVAYGAINPWWRCRFYHPASMAFEFVDYRYGQPYACQLDGRASPPAQWAQGEIVAGGAALYTFTDVYAQTMPRIAAHHLARGAPVHVALYDIDVSPDYVFRMVTLMEMIAETTGAGFTRREVGPGLWLSLEPGGA